MTTLACLGCLYPDETKLHTCGKAVAFPVEADTHARRVVEESLVEHVFGSPLAGYPGIGERYCSEPIVPGAKYHCIYHVTFEMYEGGDFKCSRCGESFLKPDPTPL